MNLRVSFINLLLFFTFVVKGQDSLYINRIIEKSILDDSTSLESVFGQDYETIMLPQYYVQNKGALGFSLQPQFSSNSWFSPVLIATLLNHNTDFKRTEFAITTANYDYGLNDSHIFGVNFSNRVGKSYLNFDLDRKSAAGIVNNSSYKSLSVIFDLSKSIGKWQNNYGYYKNSYSISENGGILGNSFLVDAEEVNEFSIPTKLNSAKNEVKSEGAYFENFYFIVGQDQHTNDSLDTIVSKVYSHGVGVRLGIVRDQFTYSMDQSDMDSSFYSNVFNDLSATSDSIGYLNSNFELAYKVLDTNNRVVLDIGFRRESYDWSVLNASKIKIDAADYRLGKLALKASYTISGLWNGAYDLIVSEAYTYRNILFNGSVSIKESLPSYFYLRNIGNHFQWDNNFNEVNTLDGVLEVYHKKINIGLKGSIKRTANYVYLDSASLPQQLNNSFIYYNASAYHLLQNKYIKLFTRGELQGANSDVVRFPRFNISTTFSYCFQLGELKLMTGFQGSYFTSFYGMEYNPNLRQLYLQDNDLVGGFPLVDFFASVKVGGADIFVKLENALFDSFSREFYLYPDYITVPRMIRVGLSWKFIN